MDLPGFIARWRNSQAAERANKDSFLNELCGAIGVPAPNPTTGDPRRDDYVFEKAVQVLNERGKSTKFIDLYKRGCFVLEAKQGSESSTGKLGTAKRDTPTWNVAMNAAFGQAIGYATALDEAPPFVVVTDIGYCFDVYASFDGTPRYRPFPNALDHRFYITRLAERADVLRKIFVDPLSLDPSKVAVEVTREVAVHLAHLTKRLEKSGHAPQLVADFLMRCIFTMFAEDVGLLPDEVFTKALKELWIKNPRSFPGGVETLWSAMNEGSAFGFFGKLLHFNGGLFKSPAALPLDKEDLQVLLTAAKCSWNKVEPAIFGALFESALDKQERHHLGAHFTPRPYVERLVRPTIEEPIREDWTATQARIRALAASGRLKEAKAETRAFMLRLTDVRVLDPACGSGNFLYVALDLLKAIEDEAFALLLALEGGQTQLCLDAPEVTPKQFLGIETNPRAKAIAELVLWIGYLQWHFRTKHRGGNPREPVLEDYRNIANRDAVLAYDSAHVRHDGQGKPVTRWDGESMRLHPVTGETVPDDRFTIPVYDYKNPTQAVWPRADFVLGNPPFIGNKRMRALLGDGYVEALRKAHGQVPETSDFVMYWWDRAAELVRSGAVRRLGLITTNSITQTQNRKVVQRHLSGQPKGSLVFACADHPWVETRGGAAVRISMTVLSSGGAPGELVSVATEKPSPAGYSLVETRSVFGPINSDLTCGADVSAAIPLSANRGLCFMGVTLVGEGFRLTRKQIASFGFDADRPPSAIRRYALGRDLAQRTDERFVIDLFGLTEADARKQYPRLYQQLLLHVRDERQTNKRKLYRDRWWVFGEAREGMRTAMHGLKRYIATGETAKHRFFVFLDAAILPDHKLYAIASDDAFILGVLSSSVHLAWALAAGGTLEDRPTWTNGTCFMPYAFPAASDAQRKEIGRLAEEIDGHRSARKKAFPDLTITDMYNVLKKIAQGEALTPAERGTHDLGLLSVLSQLHAQLDEAVLDAYGWPRGITDEEIRARLVALNAERAEEERRGMVRWVRPDYQQAQSEEATGPGVRKSAPPKGPGLAPTRAKPVAKSKARNVSRSR